MKNRISEAAERAAERPDYQGEISRKALPYTKGRAHPRSVEKLETDSPAPAPQYALVRFEFQEPDKVCFYFEDQVTRNVTFLLGPIDRCDVRVQGGKKSPLKISFTATDQEWSVDRPVMGKLGKMLGDPERN